MENQEFGDYIIYVDESGDHSLNNSYADYPVFALAFCIFLKEDYLKAIQTINRVKFEFWGHDLPIFHSSSIRGQTKEFSILKNRSVCENFYSSLNYAFRDCSFSLIATVIDKRLLQKRYSTPHNP